MVKNPPEGCQRVIPYLIYDDAAAAIAQLTSAFGFEERFRIPAPGGKVGHAELGHGDSIVMLADDPGDHGGDRPGFFHQHVRDVAPEDMQPS